MIFRKDFRSLLSALLLCACTLCGASFFLFSQQADAALRAVAGGSGGGVIPSAGCSQQGGILYNATQIITCDGNFTYSTSGPTVTVATTTGIVRSASFGGTDGNTSPQVKIAGGFVDFQNNGGNRGMRYGSTQLSLASNYAMVYSSTTDAAGTPDTGFSRCAVGVACVGSGSVGDSSGTISSGAVVTNSLTVNKTITPIGTTGSITNQSLSGTVNIAASGTTATVTNAATTANSIVFGVVRTNDATCTLKNIVPGSGSFVVTMTTTCTAATSVGYWVNP